MSDGQNNPNAMHELKTHKPAESAVRSIGLVRRTVYFTMILHPESGWIRVGQSAYAKKETAKSWLPFVRKAWRGLRGKISQCTLTYRNGVMDEKSRKVLDAKYNMDAPNAALCDGSGQ